ncbi:hypothetical protein CLV30_10198 [Haloactinopolyspora alba]|uniref:Uncharacterized protein n=1 Tax=Haloactinopolyspora alba TaxID=648780 RepID=A0A2P8EFA4_9ACTN|nr:hypothetical protein [Haloactinopolyspora alba]PSL08131.1 hypothetical protein CLV30_10198 [Haloactinopolyspora alba]
MSIPNQQDTLHAIGQAMLCSAPTGWRRLYLEVSALADTVETALVVTMVDGKVRLESGTGRLCGQLRADMFQDGKGTWYDARITVDDQGQVTVEFDTTRNRSAVSSTRPTRTVRETPTPSSCSRTTACIPAAPDSSPPGTPSTTRPARRNGRPMLR